MSEIEFPQRPIAVEVALFTILDEKSLHGMSEWLGPLVSLGDSGIEIDQGLSLMVVTLNDHAAPIADDGARLLPGAFVRQDERISEAGHRILREKVGLKARVKLREVGIFDNPQRGGIEHVISMPYWGFVKFEDLRHLLGGKDEVGLELVNSRGVIRAIADEHGGLENFDGVSRFGYRTAPTKTRGHEKHTYFEQTGRRILGLDHDEIVFYAWRKLRYAFKGQLDPFRYLGVRALGDEFRLGDLQEFNDVSRGVETQRDLFRRQALGEDSFYEPSEKIDSSRPGKPAMLYMLSADLEESEED